MQLNEWPWITPKQQPSVVAILLQCSKVSTFEKSLASHPKQLKSWVWRDCEKCARQPVSSRARTFRALRRLSPFIVRNSPSKTVVRLLIHRWISLNLVIFRNFLASYYYWPNSNINVTIKDLQEEHLGTSWDLLPKRNSFDVYLDYGFFIIIKANLIESLGWKMRRSLSNTVQSWWPKNYFWITIIYFLIHAVFCRTTPFASPAWAYNHASINQPWSFSHCTTSPMIQFTRNNNLFHIGSNIYLRFIFTIRM